MLIARPDTIRQAIACEIAALRRPASWKRTIIDDGRSYGPLGLEEYDAQCRKRIATMEALLWRT